MRTLYHYWLCPFSRKVRLILAEKKLDFELEAERTWERRPEFMDLNPAGKVPVLVDLNGTAVVDSMAIAEYLEEAYPEHLLIGTGLAHRAEVRRLAAWFDDKFAQEVSVSLVLEKILKRHFEHLTYISWLVDRRKWLAGDEFSLADVTAAAHLSVVDYLGDVPWDKHELAKDWYARIKSRPTFRALLSDRLPGIAPSSHYGDLDF
ncbi:MAG: glutathione S-transferase [Alphaproteobacteria bacterium]|nr:glutathione S-transferase [Alphaproteobacteria bacterium]